MSGDAPAPAARDAARAGLYVHVPFCAVTCPYCHFAKGPLSAAAVERWLAALAREAALHAPLARGVAFTSLFLGGGSPSAISARAFARLLRIVRDHFALAPGAEVTLEANPEGVKPALVAAWAAAGVNRLSVGAQSFVAEELRRLGRVHGPDGPARAFALARAHGIRRLSLDLMFGFPGHGPEPFARTLAAAVALAPGHVSAYAFQAEAGTPLGDAVLAGRVALPSPDAQADLYELAGAALGAAGLEPYETSNFCRPGEEARHNLTYWLRRDWLALGPSAHGLWRGRRWANAFTLADWAARLERGDDPAVEREDDAPARRADDVVMLALRLAGGLRAADHAPAAWRQLTDRYGAAFAQGERAGRLERTPGGWRLPAAHRFVADDTLAWLAVRAGGRFDTLSTGSLNSTPCPDLRSPAA